MTEIVRFKESPYLKEKITDDIYDALHQCNPIQELLREQARRWVKEVDDYVFAQFERHGYSNDEVKELISLGRIECKYFGDGNVYYMDDEKLFTIIRIVDDTVKIENGLYHTVMKLACMDAIGTRPIIE